jgi:hypothetical protein
VGLNDKEKIGMTGHKSANDRKKTGITGHMGLNDRKMGRHDRTYEPKWQENEQT